MIEQKYGPLSLAFARIWIFGWWAFFILIDPIYYLAELPPSLFIQHGIIQWIPSFIWAYLLTFEGLIILKVVTIFLCLMAALGPSRPHVFALLACAALTLVHGIIRGYGGHVHHQELVFLYAAYILAVSPCWHAAVMSRTREAKSSVGAYSFPILAIGFILILSYFSIGVARLFQGGIDVFDLGTMQKHVYHHSFKTNFWTWSWALDFISSPWFIEFLRWGFVGATVFEIVTPLAFFSRRILYLWIPAAILFHLGIWVMMNIFFIQNILLLLFFLVDERLLRLCRLRIKHPEKFHLLSKIRFSDSKA